MKLKNKKSGKFYKADVKEVEPEDFKWVQKSEQFDFDWRLEKEQANEVYKIFLVDQTDQILGLLSFKDIQDELRIHINLIEVSSQNIGKEKIYDRIAGCLLAYACEIAFEKSYDGFISLVPKTKLINHYCEKYGFQQFGRQLGLGYDAAKELIRKYL